MVEIAKKLALRTNNDRAVYQTYKYLKRNNVYDLTTDAILFEKVGFSHEHYLFLSKQLEVRKDYYSQRKKIILDHIRFEHQKQFQDLKDSMR